MKTPDLASTASDSPSPLSPDRRRFLGAGSLAALAAAAAVAPRSGSASETPGSASAPSEGWIDVRETGALGDGTADDTEAIQTAIARAREEQIPSVYLPAGTYLVSDALRLPSDLCLRGAGAGLSVLRAAEGTLFPLHQPDPRTMEVRQRRALVTTEAVGSVRERVTARSGLADLTIDWSHCPTEGFGSSCVLVDSADDFRIERVAFERCLPSDHPRTLEEMSGSGFRSECVMFSNARHCLMDGCSLVDSGYRPLSVSYGSLDITFQNGRVVAENPVWRHAFAEVHGDRMPRDETYVRSQVKFLNSSFYLLGGTAQDGICSHTGTMVIENCDFHIVGGTEHFTFVVKPFDRSHHCHCVNNRFHCLGDYAESFGVIGLAAGADNEEIVFSGNTVRAAFPASAGPRIDGRGLIDFAVGESRLRVQDNQILLELEGGRDTAAIRIGKAENFTVSGNLVEFRGEAGGEGPDGIRIGDSRAGMVTANVVAGPHRHGARLGGELEGVVLAHNSFVDSVGEAVLDESADTGG